MASYLLLEEAARQGKIDVLDNLLKENPSFLANYKLISLSESLLHVATKSGQLKFVHELMKLDPDIAREMNKDGFRPLDVAVIMGKIGIVKEILSYNQDLCLLKGKDQRTALHYAVLKGRIDVIDELLYFCPNCIQDVTAHEETALHLAVKSYQFDAFDALVKWLGRLGKESIVNSGDGDGNTVLHVSVSTKQHECIDLLLSENSTIRGTIQVNAKNADGLTALDVLDIKDLYDAKIRQKLDLAGAITSPDSASIETEKSPQQTIKSKEYFKLNHDLQSSKPSKNWFKYFKFQMQRDSPSDTRNTLLVVAALIATVCFQAGINPPNGILETSPKSNSTQQNSGEWHVSVAPVGGSALAAASAILGSNASSFLFLFGNSLGLTASTCIIIYLTSGFPFQRELHIALYSMMFTYGFAVSAIIKGKDTRKKGMAYILVTVAYILPFVLRWVPRWGKKAWKYWRRRRDFRKNPLPIDIYS
ncbi:hypothetical protein DH2020_002538 [Rehmannia glutinosa]|uniref:PGG domain-containing protein n=1 Tax=Rehmannia glutinosa TaxID=99300 RepID=A0ABR0XU15_REHGL